MKKLAYIILIIAILLLISYFVKNDQTPVQEPVVATEAMVEETTNAMPATSAEQATLPAQSEEDTAAQTSENTSAQAAPAEDSDVVEVQETSEDIIVGDEPEDDGAVDVVETSDSTTDEEETVLPE